MKVFVILGVLMPTAVENLAFWACVTWLYKLLEFVYIKTRRFFTKSNNGIMVKKKYYR